MKKIYQRLGGAVLCLALAGTLSACQAGPSNASPTPDGSAEPTVPPAVTEGAAPQSALSQAFEKVLLNESPFLYTDQNRGEPDQKSVFLSELTEEDKTTMAPAQFAVVDMDGDGAPEVVYQRSDYGGFVVLRHREGGIYGYEVSYRGLMQLKKDGSYTASSGATENSLGKMRFLGDFCDQDVKLYSTGQVYEQYYLRDAPIEKDAFDQLWRAHEELPDVDWHTYTDDMVRLWLRQDINALGASVPAERQSAELQDYLDALAGLLYPSYYPAKDNADTADFEASYAQYRAGWDQAMEKIYGLCAEKLPNEDMDALAAEQRLWLEARRQRALDSSDAALGDMTKMRTYQLISLYFGDHFYD